MESEETNEKVLNRDIAFINIPSNQAQLQKIIDANDKLANFSLWTGAILTLAGLGVFAFIAYCKTENSNAANNKLIVWLTGEVGRLVIPVFAEIAGITLLMAYKSSIKQANDYRTELIALRDLDIAIAICNKTSTDDGDKTQTNDGAYTIIRQKSQKSKMQQSIIEALLNRYN